MLNPANYSPKLKKNIVLTRQFCDSLKVHTTENFSSWESHSLPGPISRSRATTGGGGQRKMKKSVVVVNPVRKSRTEDGTDGSLAVRVLVYLVTVSRDG